LVKSVLITIIAGFLLLGCIVFATYSTNLDLDNDGTISISDLLYMSAFFGKTSSRTDVNQDGKNDLKDMILVSQNIGAINSNHSNSNTTYDWPQLQRDSGHTGYSPEVLGKNWNVRWNYAFQPERVYSQVQAIIYDGKVFVGTEMGTVHAVDADTGVRSWKTDIGCPVMGSVAAWNGRIYVGCLTGDAICLDTNDGRELWRTKLSEDRGIGAAPVIGDNKVMFVTRDGYAYALNLVSGGTIWVNMLGTPLLQSPGYSNGMLIFGAMDMRAYALNGSDGTLLWKSSKMSGSAFKDYYPVIYHGLVFIRPMVDNSNAGLNPRWPFWDGNQTWLNEHGPSIISGNMRNDPELMRLQDELMGDYNNHPDNYIKNLYVLNATTGQEAMAIPHSTVQTMNGATIPPCVDRDGMIIGPVAFINSGWARLDIDRQRITDILYDGYAQDGTTPFTIDSGRLLYPAGMGNDDENYAITCSNNLIIALHVNDGGYGGAAYPGYFDLNTRRWTGINFGLANNQMSHNTQGGGTNPVSISNGTVYSIRFHELVARSTR
jgi:outer membrane protein assembly factor BamB